MAGDHRDCPPGGCVDLVKTRGELETMRARSEGETRLLSTRLNDLTEMVKALPRSIAEQIEKERSETDECLQRGHQYFDKIFRRLDEIEKRVQQIAGVEQTVENLGEDLRAHTSGAGDRARELNTRFGQINEDKHALDRRLIVMWTLVGLIGFGELWRLVALFWPMLSSLVK